MKIEWSRCFGWPPGHDMTSPETDRHRAWRQYDKALAGPGAVLDVQAGRWVAAPERGGATPDQAAAAVVQQAEMMRAEREDADRRIAKLRGEPAPANTEMRFPIRLWWLAWP